MRRSKRKAAQVATRNITEASNTTETDASGTNDSESSDNEASLDVCEVEDLSDDEGALHGPCNVKPLNADENPRFVFEC